MLLPGKNVIGVESGGTRTMTTIVCKCQAVEVEFRTTKDLFRQQCCCYDCTAGLWYANKRGGPRAPSTQCVESSWLPNDFAIVKGEDKLGAFLNFEGADSTRFYCTQCWSVLFADHPAYEKKLVVTQIASYTEFEGLKNTQRMDFQARHFVQDVSPEEIADLPPWTGDPGRVYQGVSEILMTSFPDLQNQGSEGAEMNAQILLARIGGAFVPTNEPRLSGGPPSLMQQTAIESSGTDAT